MLKKLFVFLEEMRVKQWYKNVVVFIPLLFSGNLFNFQLVFKSILAFLSFSFIASSGYVINDLKDKESDKKHPVKRKRPIPSGRLKDKEAAILFIILFLLGLFLAFFINLPFLGAVLLYFFFSLLYTFFLKNIFLVDSFVIAFLFLFRAMGGAFAINVLPTHWLFAFVYSSALYLAFAKRFNESRISKEHKPHLKEYGEFNREILAFSSLLAFVVYLTYIFQTGKTQLLISALFLLYMILKHFYLVITTKEDELSVFLKDKSIIASFFLLVFSIVLALYFL